MQLSQASERFPVELVISIDDGFDYRSILPEDPRIVYSDDGLDSGPAIARNRALARATSTHITLMDSDDQVSENYVESIFLGLSLYEAFAVRPIYRQFAQEIRGLELDKITVTDFAEFYGSVPFVAPRSWTPTFPDIVAEDGVATINVIHRNGGTLPVVNATYYIQLNDDSFCASQGSTFTERYQAHLRDSLAIAKQMDNPELAVDVAHLFRSRMVMSRKYDKQVEINPAISYHDFVMKAQKVPAPQNLESDHYQGPYGRWY